MDRTTFDTFSGFCPLMWTWPKTCEKRSSDCSALCVSVCIYMCMCFGSGRLGTEATICALIQTNSHSVKKEEMEQLAPRGKRKKEGRTKGIVNLTH